MIAEVQLWGRTIGAVSREEGRDVAAFQYDAEFARSGIELAPLAMPLNERVYEFPALPRAAFHGLPGLLADSLPDKFGNALIDAWLAMQRRAPESFGAESLGAMAHFDFNQAAVHSYKQALLTIRQLRLPMAAAEEQFRRRAFNIVARNQDDHVKNSAFLMNK